MAAAKELGIDIYYEIHDLEPLDILDLNNIKAWTNRDYLNFWAKQGKEDYIKFQEFMKETNLKFEKAFRLIAGPTHGRDLTKRELFRKGLFKFNEFKLKDRVKEVFEIINHIKKIKSYSTYTESARFFDALVKIMQHENYDKERMIANLARLSDKLSVKATKQAYLELLMEIYNWRTTKKIEFKGESESNQA